MKKFLVLSIIVLLFSGCSCFKETLLGCNTFISHPKRIDLLYNDDSRWLFYNNLISVKENLSKYLDNNPALEKTYKDDLTKFSFEIGMNTDQIKVLIGNPTKIENQGSQNTIWVYEQSNIGLPTWFYKWGKLYFENKILKGIEVKDAHCSCDL